MGDNRTSWNYKTPEQRFWAKVCKGCNNINHNHSNDCWIWIAATSGKLKYGYFCYNGLMERAHRVAFLFEHKRWPNPHALHSCDEKLCVNIVHIFEGNDSDNLKDYYRKGGKPRWPNNAVNGIIRL